MNSFTFCLSSFLLLLGSSLILFPGFSGASMSADVARVSITQFLDYVAIRQSQNMTSSFILYDDNDKKPNYKQIHPLIGYDARQGEPLEALYFLPALAVCKSANQFYQLCAHERARVTLTEGKVYFRVPLH